MTFGEAIGPTAGPDRVIRDDLDRVVHACAPELRKLLGSSLLLTGASGFLGRYLLETVLRFNELGGERPCTVTVPTRRPDLLSMRYRTSVDLGEVVVVDWADGRPLDPPGRAFDYVVHGAATVDPTEFKQDPAVSLSQAVSMSAAIVGVARASNARRIVLIGSGAVYGDQPAEVTEIPESFAGAPDLASPTAGYGEAKRVSELLFRLSGLDHRVARVFSVIGPYQDIASSFAVPNLIRQADERGVLVLTGDGTARRSFCYASDVTAVLIKLLLSQTGHDVYNVGCREGTASIAEVAQVIADIFGGLEIRRGPAAGSRDYVPQLDRLYETYAPRVGLREGLLRTCHSLYGRGVIKRKPVISLGESLPRPSATWPA
jgi:nucleoside-diphosphate-sugar epimerase